MTRLEKDGMVAVIYSSGYGARWSTWNKDNAEYLCLDAELAMLVLDGTPNLAADVVEHKFPDVYLGGVSQLQIQWVPKGSRFEITEYDGFESVKIIDVKNYLIA